MNMNKIYKVLQKEVLLLLLIKLHLGGGEGHLAAEVLDRLLQTLVHAHHRAPACRQSSQFSNQESDHIKSGIPILFLAVVMSGFRRCGSSTVPGTKATCELELTLLTIFSARS